MAYDKNSFWYSKRADAKRCMRYYKLKHIDGIEVEQSKNSDLEFGTAMHSGCNTYLQGGDGLAMFELYWDTCKDAEFGRNSHEELLEVGQKLLTRFQRLHLKKFKPFMMEERMYGVLGSHKQEGTPDFLGDFEGVPSVLDFKTAAMAYDKRKILIDTQMVEYAVLAKQTLDYEPKQCVYMVFTKSTTAPSIQILKRPLTQLDYNDTILSVVEECDDLVSRTVFPKNTANCLIGGRACVYWNECHKGVTNE